MEGFNINMSDVYKTIFAIQVYEEKPSELKFLSCYNTQKVDTTNN